MIGTRIGGTLLPTYQRRLVALWRGMKTNLTSIGTAAVAATMLLAGSAQAAGKPAPPKSSAPSLDAAGAKVSRYARAHGALGSYYDAAAKKFVVVAAPGSALTRAKGAHPARSAPARSRGRPSPRCRRASPSATGARRPRSTTTRAGSTSRPASSSSRRTRRARSRRRCRRATPASSSSATRWCATRSAGAPTSPRSGAAARSRAAARVCTSGFPVQKTRPALPHHGGPLLRGRRDRHHHRRQPARSARSSSAGRSLNLPFLPIFDMELIGGGSYGVVDLRRRHQQLVRASTSTARAIRSSASPATAAAARPRASSAARPSRAPTRSVCTQTGCKSPVISYTGARSQPGDSGAPFYVYSGDGDPRVHPRDEHRGRRLDELRGEVEPHLVQPGRLDRHLTRLADPTPAGADPRRP